MLLTPEDKETMREWPFYYELLRMPLVGKVTPSGVVTVLLSCLHSVELEHPPWIERIAKNEVERLAGTSNRVLLFPCPMCADRHRDRVKEDAADEWDAEATTVEEDLFGRRSL
jgi:hypothetical protein